ncbi:MAG: tRNA 2-selenouridine(34) synthase MnmH [Thiobacillus sp. 63-78]|uniref:tRNA 2-selenouridine(34) synthase MnmH n=1 Tax=Thiobacillus sp. 63-78 TaxID=1895859 RepID=UPI000959B7AB|nr:tRNA 2-selenouridine(34) synthase MnmH [Thiobacillus sp. 63-78]MBN8762022.1 tRNA 2-selenouridine(34) synthase MnmH [Thiobacillus sp.]OJZ09913.1 MAG: tRNA 2-selenouridine(34) synthase MnmH [Thiobacillus sp. 63-78]
MPATVADLPAFTDIIDVRSPGEFAEDHVPGATNLPILNDAERERVGTLYKQVSSFEAKKVGAALVSRNIAQHLETWFADKPRSYRPLIYCWRGGSRSGSLTHVLQKIGFAAEQLEGGYKAYRRHIVAELERLPARFTYRVICGPTGSGKSRLLHALSSENAQVLDLEALAAHRGSLLGALPDRVQPSQKSFESAIWFALSRFDPERCVFVESESKKIGALRLPDALITAMRASACVQLEVPLATRVRLLTEDYMHFLHDPEMINRQLGHLVSLRGGETIAAWQALANARAWPELVTALLAQHYDPAYLKSLAKNYAAAPPDRTFRTEDLSLSGLRQLARTILAAD